MQSKRCGETILLSHSQTNPPSLSLMFCDQTNAHGLETAADWKVEAGAVPLHTIVTDCSHIGYDSGWTWRASFRPGSRPAKDRTVRSWPANKTGRSGLQKQARKQVGPVLFLTELARSDRDIWPMRTAQQSSAGQQVDMTLGQRPPHPQFPDPLSSWLQRERRLRRPPLPSSTTTSSSALVRDKRRSGGPKEGVARLHGCTCSPSSTVAVSTCPSSTTSSPVSRRRARSWRTRGTELLHVHLKSCMSSPIVCTCSFSLKFLQLVIVHSL